VPPPAPAWNRHCWQAMAITRGTYEPDTDDRLLGLAHIVGRPCRVISADRTDVGSCFSAFMDKVDLHGGVKRASNAQIGTPPLCLPLAFVARTIP